MTITDKERGMDEPVASAPLKKERMRYSTDDMRNWAKGDGHQDYGLGGVACAMREAADEIDLLREALKIIAAGVPGPCLFATEVLQGHYQATRSGAAPMTNLPTEDGRQDCMDMVRRVGLAICKSRTCEGFSCCQWPANMGRKNCTAKVGAYDDAARAAIEAMREPTEAMLRAADLWETVEPAPIFWPDMIDAALQGREVAGSPNPTEERGGE